MSPASRPGIRAVRRIVEPVPKRPLTRRQVFRRRRIAFFGGLAVVLGGAVYVPAAAVADVPEAVASVVAAPPATQPAVVPDFPDYGRGAVGAVGFEGVLAASGDQSAFPMASITKVVTALVVLEAKPLEAGEQGPDIEFTADDVEVYNQVLAQNGSVQPVRAGTVPFRSNSASPVSARRT